MTKTLEPAEVPAQKSISGNGRFDRISIALHSLTVLLITGQLATAWLREAVGHESGLAMELVATHQANGLLIWIVGLLRLVWRRNFAYLPPFPQGMAKLQQTIAKTNEYGLYVLLFVQPITGLSRVLLRGKPFELLIWKVSALLEPNPAISIRFAEAHEFGANALIVLIGLHVGAALFHRLVLRDGVLQRMLPQNSTGEHGA